MLAAIYLVLQYRLVSGSGIPSRARDEVERNIYNRKGSATENGEAEKAVLDVESVPLHYTREIGNMMTCTSTAKLMTLTFATRV